MSTSEPLRRHAASPSGSSSSTAWCRRRCWCGTRTGISSASTSVNFAIRTTGLIGLVFITLSLAITPLRALTGWNRLIAMRRNLGVLGFVYLAAHFADLLLFDREAQRREHAPRDRRRAATCGSAPARWC